MFRKRMLTIGVALISVLAATAGATASAPPVGALPAGPKTTVVTRTGELIAVALPQRDGGKVWRVARAFDSTVVEQLSEARVGSSVVLVFRSKQPGRVTLSFALTKGERAKALESRTFNITVT